MQINKISSYTNTYYNNTNNKNEAKNSSNVFRAKSKDDMISTVSLRNADELKYDVEYNKISRLKNDVNIIGKDINIYFKPNINSSRVIGGAYNHNLDLEYVCKGFSPNKMLIRGRIDNQDVELRYNIIGNNVNIQGDTSGLDENTITLLNMLSRDFSALISNQLNLATMIMLA